jgi:GST-like protein
MEEFPEHESDASARHHYGRICLHVAQRVSPKTNRRRSINCATKAKPRRPGIAKQPACNFNADKPCQRQSIVARERAVIELWYAPTPNGWKITIMLEECGLPYRIRSMSLRGDQFSAEYERICPTGKMPAMIDDSPVGGGAPRVLFETGAILLYLAEKSGQLLPQSAAGRDSVLSWLMWQVSALGPMLGQNGHFLLYAPEPVPYAQQRFRDEAARLYGVLDRQLARTGAYIAGDAYSIADIACFPWVMTHKAQRFTLDDYPHIKRWYATLRAREALQRGLAVGREQKMLGGESQRKANGE